MRLSALGTFALTMTLTAGACMPAMVEGGTPTGPTSPTSHGTPGTPGTPGAPTSPGTLGDGAIYSGVYQADAPVDFTQNGVLPGLASPSSPRSPPSTTIRATAS